MVSGERLTIEPDVTNRTVLDDTTSVETDQNNELDLDLRVSMRFEQLTKDGEVRTFRGLPSAEVFKCILEHLFPKAKCMQYWRGPKQTTKEAPRDCGEPGIAVPKLRPGPERKLDLQ